MKLKNKIIGEKVILRDMTEDDIVRSFDFIDDPDVMRWTDASWKEKSVEERIGEFKDLQKKDDVLLVAIDRRNEYVGYISLSFDLKNERVEYGIMLDSKVHGKGCGTEATNLTVGYVFRELGMNRIHLDVIDGNTAGIRCYEKCGFVIEGRSREDIKRDEKFYDMLHMGILRSDFEKIK